MSKIPLSSNYGNTSSFYEFYEFHDVNDNCDKHNYSNVNAEEEKEEFYDKVVYEKYNKKKPLNNQPIMENSYLQEEEEIEGTKTNVSSNNQFKEQQNKKQEPELSYSNGYCTTSNLKDIVSITSSSGYVINFLKENWYILIPYVFAMLLTGLFRTLVPHYYGKLLSFLKDFSSGMTKGKSENYEDFFKTVLTNLMPLVIAWFLYQGIDTFIHWLDSFLIPHLQNYARVNIVNQVIDVHRENYQEMKTGEVLSKIVKLPDIVHDMFFLIKRVSMNTIIFYSFFVGYLFYHSIRLGMLGLVGFLTIVLLGILFITSCSKYSTCREEHTDLLQEEIQDVFSNLISSLSSSKEEAEKDILNEKSKVAKKKQHDSLVCGIPYRFIILFAFLIFFGCLVLLSIYEFINSRITIAQLISIFIFCFEITYSGESYFYDISTIIHAIGSILVVLDFFKMKVQDPCYDDITQHFTGENKISEYHAFNKQAVHEFIHELKPFIIEFKNVSSTTYPTRYDIAQANNNNSLIFEEESEDISMIPKQPKQPKQPVVRVKNASLIIKPKERVCIIGHIGSGKSSLCKLLTRLLCYQSGDIFINGHSHKLFSSEVLRRIFRYIPQSPKLFNRSLYENITYGLIEEQQKNNKEEIIEFVMNTLHSSGLNETANKFEKKMNSEVGKSGSLLSGGEIAIVYLLRTMLEKVPCVILDEPTANLDNESRKQVYQLIHQISKISTVIAVTHDLELVNHMNKIVTMKNSEIVDIKIQP